jgi:hypothetical protein
MATSGSFGVRLAGGPAEVCVARQKLYPAEALVLPHLKSPTPGRGQSVGAQRSCVLGRPHRRGSKRQLLMPEMAFLNCGVRIVHAAVPTVLSDLILVQGAVLGEYLA